MYRDASNETDNDTWRTVQRAELRQHRRGSVIGVLVEVELTTDLPSTGAAVVLTLPTEGMGFGAFIFGAVVLVDASGMTRRLLTHEADEVRSPASAALLGRQPETRQPANPTPSSLTSRRS